MQHILLFFLLSSFGKKSFMRINQNNLICFSLLPSSIRELFKTSGRGGLPSLMQMRGSVLLGTFDMLLASCEKLEP